MKKLYKRFIRNQKLVNITIAAIIIILAVAAALIWMGKKPYKEISMEEASTKTESFINEYLMPSGSRATITDTKEEYDLYKMTIDIGSEAPVESYVSKDGRLFFPQALEMTQTNTNPSAANSDPSATAQVNAPKSDKPVVELFVMSYCPFGTQMLKGLLPVIDTLGNKIDFQLKFNDYAMHEKTELDENLVQYCVQKEQPEKLAAYLTCFLEAGDRATCLSKNTNEKKINTCVAATDKEYKVTENYNNKVDWRGNFPGFNVNKEDNAKYNVGGSPTLVINGATIGSARDSASLLRTICSAFNTSPEECNTQLNSQSPTSGFGFDYSTNATEASCL